MYAASPALRRYNRRILILSLIYAACLFAAVYLFRHHLIAGPSPGRSRWRPPCQ